jgi:hypothetical protein
MRKTKENIIAVLTGITFVLSACQEKQVFKPEYHISFDDISGFSNDPTITNNTVSHSGLNCVKINQDLIYGATFSKRLGSISATPITKVKMKAWVRLSSSDGHVKLVCSVETDSSKSLFWNALDSKTFSLKNGEWGEISGEFDISAHNAPGNIIKIYPVYQTGEFILIDDLELVFE